MKTKLKYMRLAVVLLLSLVFVQNAAARDLIVVASKATQKASVDWLGFLDLKEIPVKLVTPKSFNDVKRRVIYCCFGQS